MSNRVRILRHRLDMRQAEFAALLEVHPSSASRLETGAQKLTPELLEKLDLIEAALKHDENLGAKVNLAWEGKTGFRRVVAAWGAIHDAGAK